MTERSVQPFRPFYAARWSPGGSPSICGSISRGFVLQGKEGRNADTRISEQSLMSNGGSGGLKFHRTKDVQGECQIVSARLIK